MSTFLLYEQEDNNRRKVPALKTLKPPTIHEEVKGWEGFVGGFRFKSQWGQKFTYQKKKIVSNTSTQNQHTQRRVNKTLIPNSLDQPHILCK